MANLNIVKLLEVYHQGVCIKGEVLHAAVVHSF